MLHIVLLILKIIGIILLCILGILLLSIICALFVPVRYRIEVTREEGEGKPPFTARVKITWLLHLVNILIRYPHEVIVRVRLLFFTIFRIPKKEKKEKDSKRNKSEGKRTKKRAQKSKESSSIELQQPQDERQIEIQPENKETEIKVSSPAATEEWSRWDTDITQQLDTPENEVPEESEEGTGVIAKIRRLFRKIKLLVTKIKSFFENIQYTIQRFCDKIKSVLDNIQYYREVLESDAFRQSMTLCKTELGSVLKGLRPDKFGADVIVGMSDPAVTGEILAICGALYPLIGQNVRIVGDFECEQTRVEGRVFIRGRIRAFTFLRMAVKMYFNKDVKTLIKQLKKEAA